MDDDLNNVISRRNTESAFQAIRNIEVIARDTRMMIDGINNSIFTLINRVTEIETTISKLRIEKIGTGPTKNA